MSFLSKAGKRPFRALVFTMPTKVMNLAQIYINVTFRWEIRGFVIVSKTTIPDTFIRIYHAILLSFQFHCINQTLHWNLKQWIAISCISFAWFLKKYILQIQYNWRLWYPGRVLVENIFQKSSISHCRLRASTIIV